MARVEVQKGGACVAKAFFAGAFEGRMRTCEVQAYPRQAHQRRRTRRTRMTPFQAFAFGSRRPGAPRVIRICRAIHCLYLSPAEPSLSSNQVQDDHEGTRSKCLQQGLQHQTRLPKVPRANPRCSDSLGLVFLRCPFVVRSKGPPRVI